MEGTMAEIRMFAGNFSPRYWGYCNGQLLAISTNTALFSLLGTTYGGDGRTTFALPDMRGRIPMGTGQGAGLSNYVLGQMAGVQNGSLLSLNLPTHTHTISGTPTITIKEACCTTEGTGAEPEGQYPATPSGGAAMYGTGGTDTWKTWDLSPVSNLVATPSGASQPIPHGAPYLGINYVICMQGIFPSRD